MRRLIVATACAGVLALSGVSQAAQIASPTIYGTFDQVMAECSVVNGGPTPLSAVFITVIGAAGTHRSSRHSTRKRRGEPDRATRVRKAD